MHRKKACLALAAALLMFACAAALAFASAGESYTLHGHGGSGEENPYIPLDAAEVDFASVSIFAPGKTDPVISKDKESIQKLLDLLRTAEYILKEDTGSAGGESSSAVLYSNDGFLLSCAAHAVHAATAEAGETKAYYSFKNEKDVKELSALLLEL